MSTRRAILKHGTIDWQSLWYFHSKQTYVREGDVYTIFIRRKEKLDHVGEEIKIDEQRL